MIIMPENTKR